MGFGFNLVFAFVIIPVLVILFVLLVISRKKYFGKAIVAIIIGIAVLATISYIANLLFSKKRLFKKDYYGTYVVDRSHYPGKQSDWQFNSFRFEIKENDSIYFYCTDKNKIQKTYKGYISTVKPYNSERLVLHMPETTYHIIKDNPTLYREIWDFYLVFNSEKFGNVFFKKGKWEPQ
jgi:hypothetical protein